MIWLRKKKQIVDVEYLCVALGWASLDTGSLDLSTTALHTPALVWNDNGNVDDEGDYDKNIDTKKGGWGE